MTFAIFAFFVSFHSIPADDIQPLAKWIFQWLPRSPATCWFFNEEEKKTSRMRMLRDGTNEIGEKVSVILSQSLRQHLTPTLGRL